MLVVDGGDKVGPARRRRQTVALQVARVPHHPVSGEGKPAVVAVRIVDRIFAQPFRSLRNTGTKRSQISGLLQYLERIRRRGPKDIWALDDLFLDVADGGRCLLVEDIDPDRRVQLLELLGHPFVQGLRKGRDDEQFLFRRHVRCRMTDTCQRQECSGEDAKAACPHSLDPSLSQIRPRRR